jgi:hypothetical protein
MLSANQTIAVPLHANVIIYIKHVNILQLNILHNLLPGMKYSNFFIDCTLTKSLFLGPFTNTLLVSFVCGILNSG